MRLITTLMLTASCALVITGCTEDANIQAEKVSETETATTADSLGRVLAEAGQIEWRLVSLGDDVLLPGEIVTTIQFDGDDFSGQGPCNRYFGSRNTNPTVPGLFGPVGATRMMCSETQMLYEDQYFEALAAVADARIDNERLVLDWSTDEDNGELVFVRVLAPAEDG